jgi:transcriptional regulator with XRE-family HTH domain
MSIGAGIRDLRKERGWSQEKLARAGELSRGTVDNAEKGKVEPDLTTLSKLAQAFEMKVWEFLRECMERSEKWAARDSNPEPWDYKSPMLCIA